MFTQVICTCFFSPSGINWHSNYFQICLCAYIDTWRTIHDTSSMLKIVLVDAFAWACRCPIVLIKNLWKHELGLGESRNHQSWDAVVAVSIVVNLLFDYILSA
jgi:hypothetical protein